ncbi:MAG: hypothetical protein IJ087_14770 [Eggerthellaceae bacterium]|nr:hypothetical protein [Eggerthellaceae bacterium]
MAANANIIKKADTVAALDQEMVEAFTHEFDRFAEIIGLFGVDTVAAGTALYQYKITGSLDNTSTGNDGTSGTGYVEGDFVKRSKYVLQKNPIGEVAFVPSAKLGDVMETAGDEGDAVYFVNRQDAAAYLGNANVSTQETFGMTYLADFLGVKNVLLTNKVAAGTVFATPIENIHVYGIDFSTLDASGLAYETDAMGLIGVHHEPEYNFASADTHLVRAATFVPEIVTFIVKGAMTPAA